MKNAMLAGVVLALVVGSGTAGYALAPRRSAPAPVAAPTVVECAVPVAPVAGAVSVAEPREPAPVEVTPAPSPARPTARRLVVTHAIEDREPVDELEVVEAPSAGDRLYAFVDVANPGDATHLDVVFRHESGLTVGHVALSVPARARRYRTWAYSTRVEEPGNWTAVVRDASGQTLAVTNFEVR